MEGFVFHIKCFGFSPEVSGKLWTGISNRVT